MSLKSTEWFLDTFPSIVSLSAESVDGRGGRAENSFDAMMPFTPSKLFLDECDGDENLRYMCEQYCSVNECSYSKGLASVVSPIAGIIQPDSARLMAHLVALHGFRHRFCLSSELGGASSPPSRSYSSIMRSVFTRPSAVEDPLMQLLVSLIRYHRPNIANTMDELFGVNQIPSHILSSWLASGMVSACDGAITGRELMASIAATGESASVPLLAVAALDDIFSSNSIVINSPDSVIDLVETYSISPDVLSALWAMATELASVTPSSFSQDWLSQKRKLRVPLVFTTADGRCVLSIPAKAVVLALTQKDNEEEDDEGEPTLDPSVNDSVVFSISDESAAIASGVVSLACIAGSSIETSLRPFVDLIEATKTKDNDSEKPKRRNIVVIDARTNQEREEDLINVLMPFGTETQCEGEILREQSRDWFAASCSSHQQEDEELGEEALDSSSGGRFVVVKLKQSVWVDPELTFEDSASLNRDESIMFLKKLEFYRSERIVIVGDGATARQLCGILVRKEFPNISMVRGGFAAISRALVDVCGMEHVKDLAIIQAVDPCPAPVVIKNIPSSSSSFKATAQTTARAVKSRLSSYFKSSGSSPKPVAVVVVPAASAPIRVGNPTMATPPVVMFEIGGVEENEFGQVMEEEDFSSVDLSPK